MFQMPMSSDKITRKLGFPFGIASSARVIRFASDSHRAEFCQHPYGAVGWGGPGSASKRRPGWVLLLAFDARKNLFREPAHLRLERLELQHEEFDPGGLERKDAVGHLVIAADQ